MPPALSTLAVGRRRPAIQVRRAPALEPPYDDEPAPYADAAPAWAGPGAAEQLTLDWRRARSRARGDRRAPDPPPRAGAAGASAEAWAAVRRFVGLCLEIFNDYRPTGHVRGLTGVGEVGEVIEQLAAARERARAFSQPGQASRRPAPVGVRRLRVCEPRGGVAEAAVVLQAGGRSLALALRLERRRGRWLCTAARAV